MDRRSVLMQAAVLGSRPRAASPLPGQRMVSRSAGQQKAAAPSIPPMGGVRCDQAVFTSIRSPMGEGYRLVAASPGLQPEEKAEITRRSPSHGSLCDESQGSTGLLSYRLASGRQVVACCTPAGQEHTGRGGCRVYTHLAILTQDDYLAFYSNPILVHAALALVIERTGPCLSPPSRLDPMFLAPVREPAAFPRPCVQTTWLWAMVSQLLTDNRTTILTGLADWRTWLGWLWFMLPRDMRASVDVSVGLKYAPARGMRLVLMPDQSAPGRSLPTGKDVVLHDALCPPPELLPVCEPWLKLLHRWWQEHRYAELVRLTSDMGVPADPVALSRLAALCEDLDRARTGDSAAREALVRRYAHFTAQVSGESQLAEQILAACAE